jgi:hypothetical protein
MLLTRAPVTGIRVIGRDAALMLGVEQEYDLYSAARQLDFRKFFIQAVGSTHYVPFRNCDGAAILEAGYVLACDGQEAEFATAPIGSLGDGCLTLAREVVRCRRHMLNLLRRAGVPEVRGYSTHLNISVPPGREWELAIALSQTVGPALILLMEARQSPGLLIRPRRGRLEIGSEYIDNPDQLAAAGLFLTGVVRACLFDESLWEQFPRLKLLQWEEADIRAGIFLPHGAYGDSIYERGRSARLELQDGGAITAGELLETCGRLALRACEGLVSRGAADALRSAIDRAGQLQIERRTDPGVIAWRHGSYPPARESSTLRTLALARSGTSVIPRFVDWEGAAFSLDTKSAPLIVGVPWQGLPEFLSAAKSNQVTGYVAGLGPPEPELNSLQQLQSPHSYRALDPVTLGEHALSDKGTKGGKSKTHKPYGPARPLPPGTASGKWLRWLITVVIVLITTILVLRLGGADILHRVSPASRDTVTAIPTETFVRTPAVTGTPVPTDTATWTSTPTLTPTPTQTPRPTVLPTRTRKPRPTNCPPISPSC